MRFLGVSVSLRRRLMSNKRITIHLTELEAEIVHGAISNMWTGDGDGIDEGLKAGFRVQKKILEARRKRDGTTISTAPGRPTQAHERGHNHPVR